MDIPTQDQIDTMMVDDGFHDRRITIAQARNENILLFMVWLPITYCRAGENPIKGTHDVYETAIEQAKSIPRAEVHAIARGWNVPKCYIWQNPERAEVQRNFNGKLYDY